MRDISIRKDIGSGLFLLIVGIALSILSLQHHIWDEVGPREGFYPLVIGIILTGLSMAIVINAYRSKVRAGERQVEETAARFKTILYIGLVVIYGFFFESIGFLITSGVFLLVLLKFVEHQKWKVTIAVGLFAMAASYCLFVYFLGVPLPKGLLAKW